jgi:hypothetical protein
MSMCRALTLPTTLVVMSIASAGCGGYSVCDVTDEARAATLPQLLSATGLFTSLSPEAYGDGVIGFRPQFALWSDGADKRRWVRLPPGSTIDTSDMDSWVFPVGARFWKEFRRDGVRVETRLLEKRDDGWVGVAYLWNEDQSDARQVPFGAIDALGTPHDVPASGECVACHGGRRSGVLGFSAIQLSITAAPDELDLQILGERGLLSDAPARAFEVPGSSVQRAALGYLHANCGHCHNHARPDTNGARCFDPQNELEFQLSVSSLGSPEETGTYKSAVGSVIEPGDPDGSRLVSLVSHRGFGDQMPPLATERIDPDALALLRTWIAEMEAAP